MTITCNSKRWFCNWTQASRKPSKSSVLRWNGEQHAICKRLRELMIDNRESGWGENADPNNRSNAHS